MKILNVRDTRQHYSEVNQKVLAGLEITTVMGRSNENAVSHIRREYLDYLLTKIKLSAYAVKDTQIGGFTVVCETIDMYREGDTLESAIDKPSCCCRQLCSFGFF
ncbi:MAG TPA: hypothetical protein PKA28_01860 [Methylomusa anaerophila]|uniref:Uncharacterized protein n=1 Tax=Methylomusa anaerophila TaxID=1930071 RepID=A0A348APJ0_9FIRM|nr:hypothetical protein [Methylomusa anaerophila]BBB92988.1 hypothetical protein MAMMFC1_03697 [Methylomusa anaerophila]HML87178.1 hypothetical protein [Methylomusa anaerophila]